MMGGGKIMAKLENHEIIIVLYALKHFVREELDLDSNKIFPQMIPDNKKQKVINELEKLWSNDTDFISYLQNIYKKIASGFDCSV
jgi:hypothetical protein